MRAGQVLGLGLAALFPPEAQQGRLVGAHDDVGVGAADEVTAMNRRLILYHIGISHTIDNN